MDGRIRQEEELASRRGVPQQMEEQIEIKPDFKAKGPWIFFHGPLHLHCLETQQQ